MPDLVRVSKDQGLLEIAFCRPEKKNALSNDMYRIARDALEAAKADPEIRAILFRAEGEAFTAGNDLSDFAKAAQEEPQAGGFVRALAEAETPIVAAVQGLAVGIGTTMLLHCDLVYVTETTKLTTPFVNLGLVPEAGSSLLLQARIGYARAFAMFALGEALTGAEAVTLGLAHRLVAADDLLPTANRAARTLAGKPPQALIETKRLMRDTSTILAHLDREGRIFRERMHSPEAREAFRAFAERRPAG